MRCLVTGSEGFIGKHLTAELKKRGHEVVGIDPKKELIGIDPNELARDIRLINETDLQGIDWVFHMGAASGSLHFDPPREGTDINCVGTVNLLEACRKAGVKKLVFSATGTSYAFTSIPHKEDTPLNCPNFYTATKIFDEQACKLYYELYGLNTVILRYASVYGTGEESKGKLANVLTQFVWKMIEGKPPVLWGNGQQTRDFVNADDVASANIFAAENLGKGQVFNVGTGVETKFVDATKKINETLGTSLSPEFVQPANAAVQKKYVDRQCFDTSKLAAKGWRAMIGLDEGIRRSVEYYKGMVVPDV